MATKKTFGFPVGDSPGKPKEKIPACPEAQAESSSRKSLFTSEQSVCLSKKPVPWSDQETELSFPIHMFILERCLDQYVAIGERSSVLERSC